MKIVIPNNNLNERKYIIDVLMGEFLVLDYTIEASEGKKEEDNWKIILKNDNQLIIEDHFFNKFSKNNAYLKIENIPDDLLFAQNDFIVEKDIPVIYGSSTCYLQPSAVICGIDIFASSFFMLTRWEEYVKKERDTHDRFPATASLAYRYNFLDRPVVNEYVEMLWNMLTHLGIDQKRKKREYQLIPTHDVDFPLRYYSGVKVAKEIARDLVKNRKYSEAMQKAKEYIEIKLKLKDDPYDTFDYMINLEKKAGLKSYFFFMGAGTSPMYDDNYSMNDPYIRKLVKKILRNNHTIGIHPSYFTYDNKEQMQKEKEYIEQATGEKITCGRQHYLRFAVPYTWQNWEDNSMLWDSTMSYADKEGFRCGVCYEYSVFNILTRKKLKLKEKPLIMMEGSFVTYQSDITVEEMEQKIAKLIQEVKKYQGEFVFLWHNSCFPNKAYNSIYKKIVTGSLE